MAGAGTMTAMDDGNRPWSPITIEQHDDLVPAPIERLAALLDHDRVHWPAGALPPLAHWLYFLPHAAQSTLGADGHPLRGALLPPIDAPRRMWAGGRVEFRRPLPIGARATRRSVVVAVREKDGRSGRLTFVTVRHEIVESGAVAIVEEQDLVFRGDGGGAPPPAAPDPRAATATRAMIADEAALFRFSALTFNAHRIHYDRDYAVAVEHYPDLVVHGPYQAILLADHLLRHAPSRAITRFSFRGVRPLFARQPFTLNMHGGDPAALWTADRDGCACMEASAGLARM